LDAQFLLLVESTSGGMLGIFRPLTRARRARPRACALDQICDALVTTVPFVV
jgi:hypothetical protein